MRKKYTSKNKVPLFLHIAKVGNNLDDCKLLYKNNTAAVRRFVKHPRILFICKCSKFVINELVYELKI